MNFNNDLKKIESQKAKRTSLNLEDEASGDADDIKVSEDHRSKYTGRETIDTLDN